MVRWCRTTAFGNGVRVYRHRTFCAWGSAVMSTRKDFLYLICRATAPQAPVKIGMSYYPPRRLAALQTACPDRLMIYETWMVPGSARQFEGIVRRHFSGARLSGEWFALEPELARCEIELL